MVKKNLFAVVRIVICARFRDSFESACPSGDRRDIGGPVYVPSVRPYPFGYARPFVYPPATSIRSPMFIPARSSTAATTQCHTGPQSASSAASHSSAASTSSIENISAGAAGRLCTLPSFPVFGGDPTNRPLLLGATGVMPSARSAQAPHRRPAVADPAHIPALHSPHGARP